MDKEFYSELIFKHKSPEDFDADVYSVYKKVWDLYNVSFIDMFHSIFLASGFSEDAFRMGIIQYLEERNYCVTNEKEEA